MEKAFLGVLLMCMIWGNTIAQITSLNDVVTDAVESYIHYRDKFDYDLAIEMGWSPIDIEKHRVRYVLPEFIGASELKFPTNLKDGKLVLDWATSPSKAKRLLSKRRSSDYDRYYMVALNIEDGELAVYVMTGYHGKVGETLKGRFSYGTKDGAFLLHTTDYLWQDVKRTYLDTDVGEIIEQQTTDEMFSIFLEDNHAVETFSDTIDVLQNITKWGNRCLPEKKGFYYIYHSLLSEKNLSKRSKPFLSIDYTFNQRGEILVYFRTIYCHKQKGKYKGLQQHCGSALVFTLSQNVNGVFQIMSYKQIGGI